MKTVLIALPNDKLGGAELYLKNIAEYFLSCDYCVNVLFLKKREANGWSEFDNTENINLIYTKASNELKGLIFFLRNILYFKKKKYDYIFTSHVHLTGVIGLLLKLRLLRKKSFVARESTSIFKRFKRNKLFIFKLQYLLGYSAVDLLICQTNYMKEQLCVALPKLVDKIHIEVIPNPFNLKKNKSDFFFNEPFIVSAGRLIPEKGFDILIRSFKVLKSDFPNLKLIILGEGKLRNNLENLIKDLDLEGEVILKGHVQNVYNYFKNAEVCIVSSRIEGFPNVLLQMMSQNINVVSTLCAGGIKEMNGIITTTPDNSEGLVDAIKFCLESNLSQNREIFDRELSGRSIDQFVNKINYYLEIGK